MKESGPPETGGVPKNKAGEGAVPTAFGPCRVLVADDEHLVATGIAGSLRELGHDVVAVAADGEAAVRLARETTPDLAILDIRMPKMNGMDAASRLYQDYHIPSIMVSAYSDEEYVHQIQARGLESGVYGYLLKPVGREDLRVIIGVARQRVAADSFHRSRVSQLEKNLVNRRLVEQAKWKLVEQRRITEAEAHEKLQRSARNRRMPLADVAKRVIETGELPE